MFGIERLQTIVMEKAQRSTVEIQLAIIDALKAFQGNAPQEDDVTLVVMKLKAASP